MRITAVVCLLVAPCLCAAAPSVSPEEMTQMMCVVRSSTVPAYARTAFDEGASAWNAGHVLPARNAWVRADAWVARTLPIESPAREALARLTAEADRLSRPEPSPTPEVQATSAEARPRRRSRRKAEAPRAASDARAVMERARVAKKTGELEKAARLMRIASGLPGGEGAAAEADALEREALQPAR